MTYASQRVAYPYFVVALLLFGLQLVLGLWLAFSYFHTVPQAIVDVFPFATARAMHTNLLVLWLLLGFMGATFYLVPDEAGREIASVKVAVAQLVVLALTGVAALVGFLFGWIQGRPLLEIPTALDLVDWLEQNALSIGLRTAGQFYWATGSLSAFLDNAPTYLGFLSAALGRLVDPGTFNEIEPYLTRPLITGPGGLQGAAEVVAARDAKAIRGEGDIIYVVGMDPTGGDQWK